MKGKQLYTLLFFIMNLKVKLDMSLLVGSGEIKALDSSDICLFCNFQMLNMVLLSSCVTRKEGKS